VLHSWWFYIKNYDAAPLPLFTGRTIKAALLAWSWGPMDKEKKRVALLLGAITYLKGHGLCGVGVIGACHSRRVAPLMVCALPLFGMALGVRLEGMTLAHGLLRNLDIQQHFREALEEPDVTFPVEGHLTMRPDTSFIDLVSISRPPHCVFLFFLILTLNFVGRHLYCQFSPFRDSRMPLPEDETT
jgi:hypothetical protein